MNHLKSRPRVKKSYGRGCFSSFALSLPDNPHDYCILFPSAQTLGQVCEEACCGEFFVACKKRGATEVAPPKSAVCGAIRQKLMR